MALTQVINSSPLGCQYRNSKHVFKRPVWVQALEWAPNGRHFASGSTRWLFALVESQNWKTYSKTFKAHLKGLFQSDMGTLAPQTSATFCFRFGRTVSIKIWSTVQGRMVKTLSGHTDTVTCVAMGGEGFYSTSRDRTVRVWMAETGEMKRILQSATGLITAPLAPNMRFTDWMVRSYWLPTSYRRRMLVINAKNATATHWPSRRAVGNGEDDHTAYLWIHRIHQTRESPRWSPTANNISLPFPNGRYIATASFDKSIWL